MRTGRPLPTLQLTEEEQRTLERWARRATMAQALAQRARMVLGAAANTTNTQVAREMRVTKQTVGKWLGHTPAKNRRAVLGGWLAMIRAGTGVALSEESVLALPYQLVHRVASVCAQAVRDRAVLYQLFDPGHREQYLKVRGPGFLVH